MKRTPMKQNARRASRDSTAATAWWLSVTNSGRGPCVMCRHRPITDEATLRAFERHLAHIEGHHVIARRHLDAEQLWDVRNGIPLCRLHHSRETAHAERVPRDVLPASVFDFAAELGVLWLLDREYPPTDPGRRAA